MSGLPVKLMGMMGLTAMLAAGACVSTSAIAVNLQKESTCRGTKGGSTAYKWAWTTALTGGLTTGACVAGIVIMILA